mgnify:CR=1 FL=1
MALFGRRKRSSEIVDLSEMQKRGLLPATAPKTDSQGIVDFSGSSQGSGSFDNLDFLGHLAAAGSENSPGPITSSLRSARREANISERFNEMRIKLEDNHWSKVELVWCRRFNVSKGV